MLSILRASQFMLILKIKKQMKPKGKISFSFYNDQGVVFKLLQNFYSILCLYI